MAMTFDLSDIPAVDAADLAAAMRSLIENGRGLVLLNGATDADLDTARAVMQSRHHAEPQSALASFGTRRPELLEHLIDSASDMSVHILPNSNVTPGGVGELGVPAAAGAAANAWARATGKQPRNFPLNEYGA